MTDRNHTFQALCHEAVMACGADLGAVQRYVAARLDGMDEAARRVIMRDIERVLAFRPPDRPTREQ